MPTAETPNHLSPEDGLQKLAPREILNSGSVCQEVENSGIVFGIRVERQAAMGLDMTVIKKELSYFYGETHTSSFILFHEY